MAVSQKESAFEKRIKRHVIGKPHRFLAVAPLGFESTLAEELKFIGVECTPKAEPSEKNSAGNSDADIKSAGCPNDKANSRDYKSAGGPNETCIKVAGDGKVEFTAKLTEAWKAVAYSRIANRVLMEIANFKAENFGQLEKGTAGVPWELYLDERDANLDEKRTGLVLHTSCKHSRLYHSGAIEERVLKIVKEKLSAQFQTNSSRQSQQPANCHPKLDRGSCTGRTQHLYINLQDDRCTLWLDLAGEELYKRGHERFVAEAPLKETIAAAMIFEASRFAQEGTAQPQSERSERLQAPKRSDHITFIDPMAGSGTFSLEAAYIANGLIPGKCRDFALKHQPAFKEGTWRYILDERRETTFGVSIITSDISERPVNIIKHNAEASPLAKIAETRPDAVTVNPQLRDFFSYSIKDFICAERAGIQSASIDSARQNSAAPRNLVLLLNPPYGKRLDFDAPELYTKIGKKLTLWANEIRAKEIDGDIPETRLTVAILAPKDDSRGAAKYTCTSNLLRECPALDPQRNPDAKNIATSHGGFSLNALFATISDWKKSSR